MALTVAQGSLLVRVHSVREIEIVIATIQDVRDNVQAHHSKWFATIENMCSMVGIVPSLLRRCGRQDHRSNMQADTPSEYFCRTISIPLLDHLLSEMNSRFSKHQQTALLGLSIVPSVLVTLPTEDSIPRSSNLLSCMSVIYHHQIVLKVSYIAGILSGKNNLRNMERLAYLLTQHSPSSKSAKFSPIVTLLSEFSAHFWLQPALLRDPSVH